MPDVIIIGALSENSVIGHNGWMPWDIPQEYQQFLDFTEDQTIVIGRKSYEIFGAGFSSRHTIVLSRSKRAFSGAITCNNLTQALSAAQALGRRIFISGGAEVYQQTIGLADKMYLSHIKGEFQGDSFFPDFGPSAWRIERTDEHPQYRFVIYSKIG